ncbi:MAG: hypothetical protein AAFR12_20400 [Cyanobacteria bacterium J06626_6]
MRTPNLSRSTQPSKTGLPLKWILVIPFALQVFAAVGITGYLSLRHSRRAVEGLALQLEEEVSERIALHLDDYMSAPMTLVHSNININLFQQGLLEVEDVETLGVSFGKIGRFMMWGLSSWGQNLVTMPIPDTILA